jgi:hypothetical protein
MEGTSRWFARGCRTAPGQPGYRRERPGTFRARARRRARRRRGWRPCRARRAGGEPDRIQASLPQVGAAARRPELLVHHHAVQSVAADQHRVPGVQARFVLASISTVAPTPTLRVTVATRVHLRLVGRELPLAHQLGDQRVIARELADAAVLDEVGAVMTWASRPAQHDGGAGPHAGSSGRVELSLWTTRFAASTAWCRSSSRSSPALAVPAQHRIDRRLATSPRATSHPVRDHVPRGGARSESTRRGCPRSGRA